MAWSQMQYNKGIYAQPAPNPWLYFHFLEEYLIIQIFSIKIPTNKLTHHQHQLLFSIWLQAGWSWRLVESCLAWHWVKRLWTELQHSLIHSPKRTTTEQGQHTPYAQLPIQSSCHQEQRDGLYFHNILKLYLDTCVSTAGLSHGELTEACCKSKTSRNHVNVKLTLKI